MRDANTPITRESFAEMVRTYGPPLRWAVSRILHDPGRVDEVLQETFTVAWKKREQYRGGNLRAWLCKIARCTALDRIKRERRYVYQGEDAWRARAEAIHQANKEAAVDPDDVALLLCCVEALPAEDCLIVKAFYGLSTELEGDETPASLKEISERMHAEFALSVKPDAVRMRLYRARGKLLHCLQRQEGRTMPGGARLPRSIPLPLDVDGRLDGDRHK